MRVPKARSTNTGLLALAAVASLLLATSSPALAQPTAMVGAGGGSGWEYAGSEPSPCPFPLVLPGTTSGAEFELHHTGTFAGVDVTGLTQSLYVGPSDVKIIVDTHVLSPAGVGPTCTLPLGPVPIRSAQITSPPLGVPPTGSVNCNFDSGLYERVSSAVAFQLEGRCTVQGNQALITDEDGNPVVLDVTSTMTVETVMTIEGTMNPCFIPVVPFDIGPAPATFVENPECDAAQVVPSDKPDPSSHLVTTYQAAGQTVTDIPPFPPIP